MAIRNRADFVCPQPIPPTVDWFAGLTRRAHVIAKLAHDNRWTHGAELGLWEGATMEVVLHRCQSLHMVGVDLWRAQPDNPGPEGYEGWDHDEHERRCRYRLAAFGDRARIIKGWTVEAAAQIEPESLDFVFIDADHSEKGVRADIAAWGPKIRPGGMLLGHDANWPGVKAAIDDLVPGYWVGPDVTWGRVWRPA